MATLVCFHAHPDDECIATGGTMARAADGGHRVVLVVATKGENGEVAPGFLDDGEQLWERRVAETHRSAEILGVARVEFLGYVDSGMMGTPENDLPGSFWTADVDDAAERLAAVLREEAADAVTTYDDNGGYGHPDHIQVHRVGGRAAEIAGVERVYQSTINRDHIIRGLEAMRELRETAEAVEATTGAVADDAPDIESTSFGVSEDRITTALDVSPWLDRKRQAMAAHASQISETSFFLAMPPEQFAYAFGTEWYIRDGHGPGITETELEGFG